MFLSNFKFVFPFLSSILVSAADAAQKVSQIQVACFQNPTGAHLQLNIIRNSSVYQISGSMKGSKVFELKNQRPSLGVRAEDKFTSVWREFLDFNESGLETIPVEKESVLQFEYANSKNSQMIFVNSSGRATFICPMKFGSLRNWLGLKPKSMPSRLPGVRAVGFDIDDTLLFTTPTFNRALATGGRPDPKDLNFWGHVNACDPGCESSQVTLPNGNRISLPASAPSQVKSKAFELVRFHQNLGHQVYAITARPDVNGDVLRQYVERTLGIPKSNVYFEPDLDLPGNPKGKTDLIERLNLDIFYGDSDSDVTDSLKAFRQGRNRNAAKTVTPIRFLRSPYSNNRKGLELNKYHPGYYGEMILEGSYQ